MWQIYALIAAATAALVGIFAKVGLDKVDSTLATAVRAAIMAAALVIAAGALGKFSGISQVWGKPLLWIALSGLAGAASWIAYFAAVKAAPADRLVGVAALDRLSVVFVLIFSVAFLGASLTWKSALGATLVAAGAIFLAI
jgi:transporter family protein